MLIVSDVHGAFDALASIAAGDETVLVLGDLLNILDYRTGEGIASDILGADVGRLIAEARAENDYQRMRNVWRDAVADWDEFREAFDRHALGQYRDMRAALEGTAGYTTFGNVDRPEQLKDHLPEGWTFVDGATLEIDGWRVGIVGGGTTTPVRAQGEVSDEDMRRKLEEMGPVDVLCSHVPAAIRSLRYDVVTGKEERASEPLLDYILRHQPRFHFFGDVHQPKASTWRVGSTVCRNVGYFRATRRPVRLDPEDAADRSVATLR